MPPEPCAPRAPALDALPDRLIDAAIGVALFDLRPEFMGHDWWAWDADGKGPGALLARYASDPAASKAARYAAARVGIGVSVKAFPADAADAAPAFDVVAWAWHREPSGDPTPDKRCLAFIDVDPGVDGARDISEERAVAEALLLALHAAGLLSPAAAALLAGGPAEQNTEAPHHHG